MEKNEVSTDNRGVLTIIKPFTFLRGKTNECMGKAKNKKGEEFFIYTSSCGIETCFCWATALKNKRK